MSVVGESGSEEAEEEKGAELVILVVEVGGKEHVFKGRSAGGEAGCGAGWKGVGRGVEVDVWFCGWREVRRGCVGCKDG